MLKYHYVYQKTNINRPERDKNQHNFMTNKNLKQLPTKSASTHEIRFTHKLPFAQFESFMQNKANLLEAKMNISSVITKDYENIHLLEPSKNKPKTNPKQSQSKPIAKKPK